MPAPPRIIDGLDAAAALFAPGFAEARAERLQVAYLDGEDRLIELQMMAGGNDRIELPLRRIVERALEVRARALVLAHNHPSGDSEPSAADIRLTRQLRAIAQPLGLTLRDHLIWAGGRWTSFYAAGLL